VIGIDTNILIRYIVQDTDEAKLATAYLEQKCSSENPGFVCLIVLCEIVWVLRKAYKYDKSIVVPILYRLMTTKELEIENTVVAWRAYEEYKNGNADFSDYVIGLVCRRGDAHPVVTFDRKAASNSLFILLDHSKI